MCNCFSFHYPSILGGSFCLLKTQVLYSFINLARKISGQVHTCGVCHQHLSFSIGPHQCIFFVLMIIVALKGGMQGVYEMYLWQSSKNVGNYLVSFLLRQGNLISNLCFSTCEKSDINLSDGYAETYNTIYFLNKLSPFFVHWKKNTITYLC